MHLSAANILKALQSYHLEKQEIPTDNYKFLMDTINVNSGEKGRLKRLLQHIVPILLLGLYSQCCTLF